MKKTKRNTKGTVCLVAGLMCAIAFVATTRMCENWGPGACSSVPVILGILAGFFGANILLFAGIYFTEHTVDTKSDHEPRIKPPTFY